MRRLVAALVVLGLALTLVGCGGGEEPKASGQSGSPAAPPASAPAPASTGAAPDTDDSPTETVDFKPLVLTKSVMPSSIAERLEDGQPMLVLFFDPKQKTTDDVRAEVDAVIKKYRGMIDLVSFDVSRLLTAKGQKDENAQKAALMSSQLGVRVTPYIILVDSNGLQTARFAGYVDRSILEREVLRATD